MSFTAVVACKQRLDSLRRTLPVLLREMPVVLVDWNCPEQSGSWAESLGSNRLTVVRAKGEPYWHRSRALNLGARQVTSEWLCFFDADTWVMPGLHETLRSTVRVGSFYVVQRHTPLTGILVVERSAFLTVGGYYDQMPGRGWQDVDLRCRLKWAGLTHQSLKPGLLHHLAHDTSLGADLLPDSLPKTIEHSKRAFLRHMREVTKKPFADLRAVSEAFPGLMPGS